MITFEARNTRGLTVRTFGDLDLARSWVRENACLHDGLCVEEVSVIRRRVYTPRSTLARLRVDA